MTGKLALSADPISSFGLVSMPTSRTAARCSSFRAGEAHDVSSLAFMGQVVDVFAIFPQGHTLIVMAPIVLITDTVGIADEEGANLLLNAEVDDFSRGFVPQVTNTPLSSAALLILRSLQFLPATRILFAPRLRPSNLPQLLASLVFERANPASGDDHGRPGAGGHGGKVDLTKIHRRLDRARSFFCLWYLDGDMQLEAVIPDQAARPAVFKEINGQHQGRTILAHWQHHTPMLTRDGLRGPLDRIKAFGAPGILHLHLRVCLPEFVRGFDVGKEGGYHYLNRLAMQFKTSFGGFLQRVSSGPLRMADAGRFVRFHTRVPDLCCLHLSRFAALELPGREMIQLVDFHRFHGTIVP